MKEYKKLLISNKAWASERLEVDEHYFDDLSKDQNPLFYGLVVRIPEYLQKKSRMQIQVKFLCIEMWLIW